MRICSQISFDGPNVHCRRPVLECLVDLEDLDEILTSQFPALPSRLLQALPGLEDHHCGLGRAGGFAERLHEGTLFGHVLEHVAIEFVHVAGEPVRYGKTRATKDRGVYRVVVEQDTPELAQAALREGLDLIERLRRGLDVDVASAHARLAEVARAYGLGPSTRAIAEAARAQGVPVRRLGVGSFLQLGHGRKMRRIEATIGAATAAVAVDSAQDKELTRRLLELAGLPVPPGVVVRDAEAAGAAWAALGAPLAVKPRMGHQGQGVTLGVDGAPAMREAYQRAARYGPDVLCERHVAGLPVRVLVVGDAAVAAAVRHPARVVGDGVRTVRELVAVENMRPERGAGHERPLTRIRLDETAEQALAFCGLAADSVPEAGRVVLLRLSANLSTGGTAEDVTDRLHPDNARLAVRAARAVGLDVAGVDMILPVPERSYRQGGGALLEVNASPGLRMHIYPSVGRSRSVAQAIVTHMFGEGDGRIPIAAITGTNGKTTVARLVAHIVALTGRTVGLTTTDGIRIGDEEVARGDDAGPRSARIVLSDPRVDVAVLECARGGMRRRGLGFDRCSVGAVLNVASDHLGQDGIDDLDALAHLKALIVDCVDERGVAVLNARDARVRAMAARASGRAMLFSARPDDRHVERHVRAGGEAVTVAEGWLVALRGRESERLIPLRRLAFAFGGVSQAMVENACGAAAVALGLGVEAVGVARGLLTFAGGPRDNPGRMNLLSVRGVRVLLDYGHNAPAVAEAAALGRRLTAGRLIGVVCSPGDRRDVDIERLGETAGRRFDHVWIKEDRDRRGRAPGEVAALLRQGALAAGMGAPAVEIAPSEEAAVAAAMAEARVGDLVVFFYESYARAREALEVVERSLPPVLAPASEAPVS